MIELASYSYMSGCSCFTLMNHNPKLCSYSWLPENVRESRHQLRNFSYVLTNYVLPSLLRQGSQQKLKLFQKSLISRSLWKTFLIKCLKVEKALAFILQSASLRLLEMSGIDCIVIQSIPENLAGSDDFSNFAGLLQWVYVKIL